MTQDRVLEIRTYLARPGARDELARRMEGVLPMLERYGIDVVGLEPSAADDEHYTLIRAFPSLAAREEQEERFYGSVEWRDGPREGVLELIESYQTVVLHTTVDAVEALRRSLRPEPRADAAAPVP